MHGRKPPVGLVLSRLLLKIIFQSNDVANYIEVLDDTLTNHCTREKRIAWINRINIVLQPRFVRRIIENRLNKGMSSHEVVELCLDVELPHSQIFKNDKPHRQKWSNWFGNHSSEPLQFRVPGNGSFEDFSSTQPKWKTYDYSGLKELSEIVKKAGETGLSIRAVGSGHALSAIAQCNDILVCTHNLNMTQRRSIPFIRNKFAEGFEVEVNYGNRKAKEKHFLFETGGGTKINHLITALEQEGLALINQGGSTVQAISGAISTATHGSGIGIGPFSDFVKSMTIVSSGGKIYRIEPRNGITDRSLFEQDPEVKNYSITLIQDDDVFNSVVVGIGAMGIVFSLILEVREPYSLYEERTLRDWEKLREEMQAKGLYAYVNSHRHFEVMINPYIDVTDESEDIKKRKCLVTTRDYSKGVKVSKNAEEERNYISSFISGIAISGRLSPWVFNKNHVSIPKLINNSLRRLDDNPENGGGYVDLSYKVLDQGLGELKFYGYAIEIGFEIERLFEVVDHIIEICDEAKEYGQLLAAPIALRFVRQSPAYLSMMNSRDLCMIELVSVKGVTGSLSLLKKLEKELLAKGGIPHWGLHLHQMEKDQLKRAFPGFEAWEKNYKVFGGVTFSNRYMETLLAD